MHLRRINVAIANPGFHPGLLHFAPAALKKIPGHS